MRSWQGLSLAGAILSLPCAAHAQDATAVSPAIATSASAPLLPAAVAAVQPVGQAESTTSADGADAPSQAPSPNYDKQLSAFLTGGTLGLGPEIRYRFAPRWGVRASATYIGLGLDSHIDGIDYGGDLRLGSAGAAVDFFLGRRSNWYVSAGLRYDANVYRLKVAPAHDLRIGDRSFTPDQIGQITGRIEGAWQVAPILTVGHVWGGRRGLQFGFEVGAMFHKALEVKSLQADGAIGKAADFLQELAKERGAIDRDLEKLNVFPIAQLVLGFKF